MESEKVPCPTKKPNGEQCGFYLLPEFIVCPMCAGKVDQALFKIGTIGEISEEHLNSNENTVTNIRTESGNPVAQSEDHPPNRCTETTEREENESNVVDGRESQEREDKVKEDNYAGGLEIGGGRGEKEERGENGNRKQKREEEDEGGGSKSKKIKKESGKDADDKVDIKDEDQEKTRESIGQEEETKGGKNEKEGGEDDGQRGRTEIDDKASEKDRNSDDKAEKDKEKKKDEAERKKRDLGNGDVKEEEGEDIQPGPLLRSCAEEESSTNDMVAVSQESTVQNQQTGQNAHTSDLTGQLPGSSKKNQPKEMVKVCFHAFLAPTVDFNPKKDELYVVFGPKRNDWNPQKEGLMNFIGTKKNKKGKNGIPVFAEVELEKDLVKNDGLSYKYCLLRKGNKFPENEFLFQYFYPYNIGHRMLTVPDGLDSYQQYDGFIYAKKGGFVVNFFKDTLGMANSNMIEVMRKDGKYALKQYLPNICGVLKNPNQDPSTIISKIIEYIDVFQGGVKDHFLIQRNQVGHGIWQEFIMKEHLRNAIEVLDSQENKMDDNGRLLKALMIVKLLENLKFHMDILHLRTVEILHHSLLLSPDTEKNQCPQLDFLETYLEPSTRENVRRCLITFLKASSRKTESSMERNPSWVMCLPIVHFLGGSLQPFEELDYANFEDKTEEWWLVHDFEKEKEELKTHKWSR